MKSTLSYFSSFKYINSTLARLHFLMPFLFSSFPQCKILMGSATSFCDFFWKPEMEFTWSEALCLFNIVGCHFWAWFCPILVFNTTLEVHSCLSGLPGISLYRRYTQNRNWYSRLYHFSTFSSSKPRTLLCISFICFKLKKKKPFLLIVSIFESFFLFLFLAY